jgi:energy-coupling factor transporter transmembrane protein EcfT
MGYFSDTSFIITIIVMLLILLFSVVAHFYLSKKLKLIKYILNGVSALILIYFIILLPLAYYYDRSYAKKIIGIYKINVDFSKYGNIGYLLMLFWLTTSRAIK